MKTGSQEYERSSNPDYRNGRKTKKIRGNFGETEIEVPQDRDGSFEPKVVKKRQKDISGIIRLCEKISVNSKTVIKVIYWSD